MSRRTIYRRNSPLMLEFASAATTTIESCVTTMNATVRRIHSRLTVIILNIFNMAILFLAQTVADAVYGFDVVWLRRVLAQLLTQVFDVGIDGAFHSLIGVAKSLNDQL